MKMGGSQSWSVHDGYEKALWPCRNQPGHAALNHKADL